MSFAILTALKVKKPLDIKPGELRCPYCYGKDIVPSMPRGIWDAVLSGMGRVPRHCRFCGRRFHPKIEEIERDAAQREGTEKGARRKRALATLAQIRSHLRPK